MHDRNGNTPLAPGQQIPIPDNFPVAWTDPDETKLLWQLDPMHYPDPMRPLEFDLMAAIYAAGMKHALQAYDLPVRLEARQINTYLYGAFTPQGLPPAPVIRLTNQLKRVLPGLVNTIERKAVAAMTQRYLAKMEPVIAQLGTIWVDEFLPEIKQSLAEWAAFELSAAPADQLVTHFEATLAKAKRAGEIHFLIAFPYLLALSRFDDLYVELFAEAKPFDSYRLLQGFDNKNLQGGRALWQLSRKAQTMPEVRHILEYEPIGTIIPKLEESVAGQIFLTEFQAYLAEYGQRGDKFSTIADVSWLEDPTPVIKSLKDYIRQPNRDMIAELAAEADERERLVAVARRHLQGKPQAVIEQFNTALKAAQAAIVIHADHGFWIDYCVLYQVRQVMLEMGRRLTEIGVVATPNDVFYLTLPELQRAASDLGRQQPPTGRQAAIVERKAEVEHFRTVQPPKLLGTMPLLSPPDEPFTRMLTKFEGTSQDQSHYSHQAPNILEGNGGSPGIVQGTAKVVHSIYQAEKLQPGDILVAETTSAVWSPLFATVAAVITDTGGILSHCAVVAREYHIPAVVGASIATKTIKDGDLVEVDGEAGIVRILS